MKYIKKVGLFNYIPAPPRQRIPSLVGWGGSYIPSEGEMRRRRKRRGW
jgi:hypothetical protein